MAWLPSKANGKANPSKEDHEGHHRWERSYGRFYWSLRLPKGAKTDQLRAEMEDGVLKVTVLYPKP